MQQTMIPMSMFSVRTIKTGDIINLNVFNRNLGKTFTRWYRVVTVDFVNELVGCVFDHEDAIGV
jgi:hypothetical protein